MKYLEREFYRGYWFFGTNSSATIENWFKIKDWVFRGIKNVTKRHRRSIRIRDIQLRFNLKSRLYEYTSKDKKEIRRLWIKEY